MPSVGGGPTPAPPAGGGNQDDRAVKVQVTIDRAAGTMTVVPDVVTITKDGGPGKALRVLWTITGMAEGESTYFENKVANQPDYFPGMPKVVTFPLDFTNSGNPSLTGTWTYSVVLKNKAGKVIAIKDPTIISDPGP